MQSSWRCPSLDRKTGGGSSPLQWPHLWTPQGPTGSWGSDSSVQVAQQLKVHVWHLAGGPPRHCSLHCFVQLHPPSTRKAVFSPHPAPLPPGPSGSALFQARKQTEPPFTGCSPRVLSGMLAPHILMTPLTSITTQVSLQWLHFTEGYTKAHK